MKSWVRYRLAKSINAPAQVPLACASLVNKPMAALATGALRVSQYCRLPVGVAVSLGYCPKSGVQQGNVSQRKALGASTAVLNTSPVDKPWRSLR